MKGILLAATAVLIVNACGSPAPIRSQATDTKAPAIATTSPAETSIPVVVAPSIVAVTTTVVSRPPVSVGPPVDPGLPDSLIGRRFDSVVSDGFAGTVPPNAKLLPAFTRGAIVGVRSVADGKGSLIVVDTSQGASEVRVVLLSVATGRQSVPDAESGPERAEYEVAAKLIVPMRPGEQLSSAVAEHCTLDSAPSDQVVAVLTTPRNITSGASRAWVADVATRALVEIDAKRVSCRIAGAG